MGTHLPRLTRPRTQEGPALSLMLRHHHLEILKHFQMRGPAFAFCTGHTNQAGVLPQAKPSKPQSPAKGGRASLAIPSSSHEHFLQSIFTHQGIFEEMSLIPGTLIHLHQLSLFRGDLGVM